jgi:adenylate cyclase
MERRLSAIFAADMVGYSRLMEADEIGTLERQKVHRRELIDTAFEEFHGRIVKEMGDGVLVEFPSVVEAVQCAVKIQRSMSEREADVPDDRKIIYRIGINLGDIVVEGEDIYGGGVNVAARLEALSEPGGICLSGTAYDHLGSTIEVSYEALGEVQVKNIDRPIRAYKVLTDPEQAGAVVQKPPRRIDPRYWAAMGLSLLLAIGVSIFFWTESENGEVGPGSLAGMKPALAVLPFSNMGQDRSQQYFSDAFTEDLTTALSRIPGFLVTARNTAFTYKENPADPREVGRELRVRYVLDGSVRKYGERLRLNVQLIETDSGTHVWAEQYNRPLADIFVIQDELVERIVGSVASRLRREEGERSLQASAETLEAYDLTSRARLLFRQNDIESIEEARRLLKEAIDKAPRYAPAYFTLAQVEQFFFTSRVSEEYARPATAKRVVDAASMAATLDPENASARAINGMALRMTGDYDKAAREARRALELSPNDPDVLAQISPVLLGVGDYSGTVEAVETARSLDPYINPLHVGVILSQAHFALGNFQAAKETALDCLDRSPDDVRCHESLVRALGELGPPDQARDAAANLLQLSPGYTVSEYVKRAQKNRNDTDAIVRWADGLRKAGVPES